MTGKGLKIIPKQNNLKYAIYKMNWMVEIWLIKLNFKKFTFFVILEQKPWDECSYQKSDLQVVILLNEIIVAPVKR